MEIVKVILMYFLAILAVAIVGNLFLVLSIPLRYLMRKIKLVQPIIWAVLDIISNFIAVFVIVFLCNKFIIKPTLLMIIIPTLLTIQNNTWRIKRAKKGTSNVKHMLDRSGESDVYDQKLDIINEYAHQIGDITGLLLGTLYFLSDASLF